MLRISAVLLSLFCTGCFSMDTVDLDRQLRENEIFMTADPAPEGAYPLSTIAVEQVGWYLLGIWAISAISLEECVQSLVDQAQSMEADGVANIRFEYGPASFFRFSIFPIPDWSATITMTGMAFRMPDPAKAFWKPKPAPGPGR